MNSLLRQIIARYVEMVLEMLDFIAKLHHIARPPLVELFIDTLQALEQNKEQED